MEELLQEVESLKLENAQLREELFITNEIITGFTDDLDVFTKGRIIIKAVHCGGDAPTRYTELCAGYIKMFRIDLDGCKILYNESLKDEADYLSIIQYAIQFGVINNLYSVAVKLYETDIENILEELRNTTD